MILYKDHIVTETEKRPQERTQTDGQRQSRKALTNRRMKQKDRKLKRRIRYKEIHMVAETWLC